MGDYCQVSLIHDDVRSNDVEVGAAVLSSLLLWGLAASVAGRLSGLCLSISAFSFCLLLPERLPQPLIYDREPWSVGIVLLQQTRGQLQELRLENRVFLLPETTRSREGGLLLEELVIFLADLPRLI